MALAVSLSVDSSTCSDDAVPLTRIELKIMKERKENKIFLRASVMFC